MRLCHYSDMCIIQDLFTIAFVPKDDIQDDVSVVEWSGGSTSRINPRSNPLNLWSCFPFSPTAEAGTLDEAYSSFALDVLGLPAHTILYPFATNMYSHNRGYR